MTRLSVNINKIATLRNARGGNIPDVLRSAVDCQRFGADGITVHPRPDERHIRYQDVRDIKKIIKTEFNIEGYPSRQFIDLVLSVMPDQVTLVPDPPDAITSNQGWDTISELSFLTGIIANFRSKGIRTSILSGPGRIILNMPKRQGLTGLNSIPSLTQAVILSAVKRQ
jgi:pyridoxine 5-phosphate synthase